MADYNKIAHGVGEFFQAGDWKQAFAKKGAILDSNKAINPLSDGRAQFNSGGMMSGIPRTISNVRHGNMSIVDAAKIAHTREGGGLDYGAIAGSYMAASAAYRVASGGGITRDAQGNPNLIGIPFV